MALLGLIGAVLVVLVFGGVSVAPTLTAHVHFGHMAGLEEGADVHIAGRLVGRVTSLRLIPAGTIGPEHPLHPMGGVTADIRIEERYAEWAPKNGEYFVGAKGVLGKRFIEVGPPAGGAAFSEPLAHGDDVRGIDPPILDRAIYNTIRNLDASRTFFAEMGPEARVLADRLDELGSLLDEVLPEEDRWQRLIDESGSARTELARAQDNLGELDAIGGVLGRARGTMDRVEARIAEARAGIEALRGELDRVGRAVPADLGERFRVLRADLDRNLATLDRTLASAQELMAMLERGEGTIGALIADPEFSDDARDLGKILKRQPWKVFGHPGNRRPEFGKPPEAPDL